VAAGAELATQEPAGEAAADLPQQVDVGIRLGAEQRTLRLYRHSVRSEHFSLYRFAGAGAIEELPVGPVRTYQGFVVEEPGAQAAVLLRRREPEGVIYRADGEIWELSTDDSGRLQARLRAEETPRMGAAAGGEQPREASAGSDDAEATGQSRVAPAAALRPSPLEECGVVQAELALDCSYSCFERKNLDLAEVEAMFEQTINELNIIYVRDLRIEYLLGRTVVRTTPAEDPYYGLAFFDKLDVVKSEWNSGLWGDSHDQTALVDGDGDGAGLAWVGSVCTSNRYSINGFSGDLPVVVMRHELGHNWGSGHYEGGAPEGPTIMSGNSIPRFSGPEKEKIMPHRNSRTCLDAIGPYPTPIPPYAHFDDYRLARCGTLSMDVLSNDEDANCQPLEISDWETETPLGGTVSLEQGMLRYEAPSESGVDRFTYSIEDSDGLTATGNIRVTVYDPNLLVPKGEMGLHYVDSEQPGYPATLAFDDDPTSFWHTRWSWPADPYPHDLQIDLGSRYYVGALRYLPRQDGSPNGHLASYRVFTSLDGVDWGQAAATGIWSYSLEEKRIDFSPRFARFVRLRGLSEVNGNDWASAAEITVEGEALHLAHTELRRGERATLTASGAEPGERVYFVASAAGRGCGPCPPGLGGLCLDLLEPEQLLGSAIAGANGDATLAGSVPLLVPELVALQAVIRRGAEGEASLKSGAVEAAVAPAAAPSRVD
jgi:hypothetical protein